jgi:hypothetical protein
MEKLLEIFVFAVTWTQDSIWWTRRWRFLSSQLLGHKTVFDGHVTGDFCLRSYLDTRQYLMDKSLEIFVGAVTWTQDSIWWTRHWRFLSSQLLGHLDPYWRRVIFCIVLENGSDSEGFRNNFHVSLEWNKSDGGGGEGGVASSTLSDLVDSSSEYVSPFPRRAIKQGVLKINFPSIFSCTGIFMQAIYSYDMRQVLKVCYRATQVCIRFSVVVPPPPIFCVIFFFLRRCFLRLYAILCYLCT